MNYQTNRHTISLWNSHFCHLSHVGSTTTSLHVYQWWYVTVINRWHIDLQLLDNHAWFHVQSYPVCACSAFRLPVVASSAIYQSMGLCLVGWCFKWRETASRDMSKCLLLFSTNNSSVTLGYTKGWINTRLKRSSEGLRNTGRGMWLYKKKFLNGKMAKHCLKDNCNIVDIYWVSILTLKFICCQEQQANMVHKVSNKKGNRFPSIALIQNIPSSDYFTAEEQKYT